VAGAAPAVVDPDTGLVVAGAAPVTAAGDPVTAVPVSLTDAALGDSAGLLMALSAVLLLMVAVLPPLLSRRLRAAGRA
jgi:hypothetical protein